MCNYYKHEVERTGPFIEAMGHKGFAAAARDLAQPTPDIFPDREAIIARLDQSGTLVPDLMRWGFPPVQSMLVTNVRNTESRFWRPWLQTEWRCLVPATLFSEYSAGPPKGNRWFGLTDDTPFCFAGIWRPFDGVRGTKAKPVLGAHKVFAFLTTTPNELVAPIHPKAMPVILPPEHWDLWLTGSLDEALELQRPFAAEGMRLVAEPH